MNYCHFYELEDSCLLKSASNVSEKIFLDGISTNCLNVFSSIEVFFIHIPVSAFPFPLQV